MNDVAEQGFSRSAELYEKGRPEFQAADIKILFEATELSKDSKVIELGAGTGKFTKHILEITKNVIATEPVNKMREALAKTVSCEVVASSAEAIPFKDSAFDVAFAANAYHWFDFPKANKEIYRVLKPGGFLGLIWYSVDTETKTEWLRKILDIMDTYSTSVSQYNDANWKNEIDKSSLFNELNYRGISHELIMNTRNIIDRFASTSFISALDELEFTKFVGKLEVILANYSTDDRFVMPYMTHVYWCRTTKPDQRHLK